MAAPRRRCPVIVGPTAVGKTDLIAALAAEHPVEVISLDSRQIYRGLRIGTAQPTAREQAVAPHHLIDFVDPAEQYDAMRYRRDFERVFNEITARGGRPVLVGGAGMYLTALREGFLEIPGSTPEKLAAVRAQLDVLDDRAVGERLHAVDAEAAERLHPNDRYRRQRALEICLLSGRTMTALTAAQRPDPALELEFPVFVLERPTGELDHRIVWRTGAMLDAGWIAETEAALADHPADCPGLLSIGYREIVQHLQGELSRLELAPAIVRATRQYAKRQRTWFRSVECVERGSPEAAGLVAALAAALA